MSACTSCNAPKTSRSCGICHLDLCKNCIEHLPSGSFSLLPKIPEDLTHHEYCRECYLEKVLPHLESYEETLVKAKEVYVFYTTQRKAIPLILKSKERIRITNCADRDETILRLGFLAAQKGFNSVIEVDVQAEKIRNHAYQTSVWAGSAYPANVNTKHVDSQFKADLMYR